MSENKQRIKDCILFRWNSLELKTIFSHENTRNSILVLSSILLAQIHPGSHAKSEYSGNQCDDDNGRYDGDQDGKDGDCSAQANSEDKIPFLTIMSQAEIPEKVRDYVTKTALYEALVDFFGCDQNESAKKYGNTLSFSQFLDSILDSAVSELALAEREFFGVGGEAKKIDFQGYRNHFAPVEPAEISFSMQYCRCILANAFLTNIRNDPVKDRKENVGGLSWYSMYSQYNFVGTGFGRGGSLGSNKIKCLIQYFIATEVERHTSKREITFQRLVMTDEEFKDEVLYKQEDCTTTEKVLDKQQQRRREDIIPIRLHDSLMENPSEDAFVNFANANYGYGRFVNSCTQEEILQMCCPEMNIGMLMYGMMDSDTVILVHNCRRYSKYKGYLSTFKFVGPIVPPTEATANEDSTKDSSFNDQTLVTLDAVFAGHYTDRSNLRDTKKAYMAWRGVRDWFNKTHDISTVDPISSSDVKSESIRISTGRWGCGAFGGAVLHKYVQQMVAVELANGDKHSVDVNGQPEIVGDAIMNRKLALSFSAFNDPDTLYALEELQKALYGSNHGEGTKGNEGMKSLTPSLLFDELILGGDGSKWTNRNVDGLVAKIHRLRNPEQLIKDYCLASA